MHAFEVIEKLRVVPVAVIEQVESALPLAEALLEGGLNLIEVTLRTEAAFETIGTIRSSYPKMIVAAGTILDADGSTENSPGRDNARPQGQGPDYRRRTLN